MKNTVPTAIILLLLSLGSCFRSSESKIIDSRPNILWITCEDISPHLGCYGDPYAHTPTLDALAEKGVRFSHAFSVASVCTPARSTLITGVYASSQGTQHLRADIQLSRELKCFTAYLREAGYYCTNNAKEDYNFKTPPEAWDESSKSAHWRKRDPGQPFFSVFNFTLTHQSQTRYDETTLLEKNSELPDEARHVWEDAPVPPYYPDTRMVRSNLAALHTQITLLDIEVQKLLRQLAEDGLEDETIIFFYSDHGDGLPRHKRWLHDSGTRVPFIVYVPEKYKSKYPVEGGSVVSDLVCFEDFPPTVLSLAGIPIPDYMKGFDLFNAREEKRSCVFTIRDRVDEVYVISRGVREERYHYIRNFLPQMPRMPFSDYSEITPIRKELRRLHQEGKLKGNESWLVSEHTPSEELFDTENDPHELTNLATDPAYADDLGRMQGRLKEWMIERRDLSLIPEPEMITLSGQASPYDVFAGKDRAFFEAAFQAADRVGRAHPVEVLIEGIVNPLVPVRHWNLVALEYLQRNGELLPIEQVEPALDDPAETVRIMASALILRQEDHVKAKETMLKSLDRDDSAARLQAVMALFRLHRYGKIDPRYYQEALTNTDHQKSKIYTPYINNLTRVLLESTKQ
jgi:uncharacterized sulfatase